MTNPSAVPGGPRPFAERLSAILSTPVRRVEFLAWAALAAILIVLRLSALGGPLLENDSYQYLSVARNFAQGRPAATSIVHFDTERTHGVVPAPMTTFPSGYPAAAAAFGAVGLAPETAAVAVSAVALLALVLLYQAAARSLELGGLATRFLLLWTFANAQVLFFSTSVLTEGLFTLVATGAVLLLGMGLARRPEGDRQLPLLLAANGLIGLAYWVRYAGLFLYVSAGALFLYLLVRRHHRAAWNAALGLGVSTVLVALGFARNLILVGNWKGGNEKVAHHALSGVAVDFVGAIIRLISGNGVTARVLLLDLVLFAALVLGVILAVERRRGLPRPQAAFLEAGLCFIGLYCAALIYLGRTSVITFGVRMFFPLLPIGLMACAVVVSRLQATTRAARQGLLAGGVLLASCVYVVLNTMGTLHQTAAGQPHQAIRALLGQEAIPGRTLAAWLSDHLEPGEVLVANQGQATAYVLQRPVVSLVSLSYSRQIWDEEAVKAAMRTYHARYLVLYAGDAPDLFDSPFLESAVAGSVPAWLQPVAGARGVRIYRAGMR